MLFRSHIYDFGQHNLQFTNHYSGGDCTQPGMFSLFYALPPTYWNSFLAERQAPVFMQTLQKQGYKLGIYGSAPLTEPPFQNTVFANIKNLQLTTSGSVPWERDVAITNSLVKFIKDKRKQPFFAFGFYDAVHGYDFPGNAKTPFKPWWHKIGRAHV